MRITPFNKILIDAVQLCGLDRTEITDQTFRQMRDFASNRLKMAWEYDKFPDICRMDSITTVYDSVNQYYYFVKPDYVGEIFNVWFQNPNSTTRAKSVNFLLATTNTDDRVILTEGYSGTVFIEYRLVCPQIWGEKWSSTTTYHIGSQTYFDVGSNSGSYQPVDGYMYEGNFYNCIIQNINTNPDQNTTQWQQVNIPVIFGNYVARGVFADYLRSEGQFDNAQIAEQEAKHFLDVEIDKIVRQQGQIQKYNFIKSY